MSNINAIPLLAAAGGDYQISRSVRLRASASASFTRTPASSGSQTTFTHSLWVKRGLLSSGNYVTIYGSESSGSNYVNCAFYQDTLYWTTFNGTTNITMQTAQVFRDVSAWYHLVIAVDTTQATASNRVKLYVNGAQITAGTFNYPAQNQALQINTASFAHKLGFSLGFGQYFDGYMAEVHFIDGQALTPAAFGETDTITGVWKPKKYTGTYGTNGFYLNFADNSAATAAAIGKDSSGNGNNWTPNNISLAAGTTYDSMLDVPTMWADGGNGRGNYATLNPITRPVGGGGAFALTNGNLRCAMSYIGADSTIAMSSGKWYWEVQPTSGTAGYNPRIGIVPASHGTYTATSVGDGASTYGYASTGQKGSAGSYAAYGASFADNDVIGVALDMDAGTLAFYKNGVSQGTAYTGITGEFVASVGSGATGGGLVLEFNFGQRPFAYTPPAGFKALHTGNLPEPSIKKPNQHFDVSLWAGNGTGQSIVNAGGFQPDLVWIKGRNTTQWHGLYNSVVGATKYLVSNSTNAEATYADTLTAFNSNGFSLGNDVSGSGVNTSGINYVAWQWKEGATPGFDVVTYTGTGVARTVAHSLGVAPKMMIVKNRSSAVDWLVWHAGFAATHFLNLNTTIGIAFSTAAWNDTAPTSSVFTVGSGASVNGNGNSHVAYLFSEVPGFSKFGSYTGNGSTDGPFVYCGFRPKFVMIKNTNVASNWLIRDTSRDIANQSVNVLFANTSDAETVSVEPIDILSNGFKVRGSASFVNGNGNGLIYMAFAESPFKNSLAR